MMTETYGRHGFNVRIPGSTEAREKKVLKGLPPTTKLAPLPPVERTNAPVRSPPRKVHQDALDEQHLSPKVGVAGEFNL